APRSKQAIECLGLRDRSWKTIQHRPSLGVRLVETLSGQADHDLIRDECPGVHVALGLDAQPRPVRDSFPKHVARRDMGDTPLLGERGRLGALAGPGWPKEDDAETHACAFAFFRRKPS